MGEGTSSVTHIAASRYEITAFVGPCTEAEADELSEVVASAIEGRLGAVVGWRKMSAEEERLEEIAELEAKRGGD